jgi:putative PIN family toxin of toxin-antitoxin system
MIKKMQENSLVLDVNIWISYFISHQIQELVTIIKHKKLIIYRSNALTKELNDVINRQKIAKRLKLPVEDYISFYHRITIWFNSIEIFKDCPDPKDNYLFDLAYQTKSKYLVSGDKIVLATKVKPSLKLITLTEFKQMFS